MQLGDKKLLVQRASVGSKNATLVSVQGGVSGGEGVWEPSMMLPTPNIYPLISSSCLASVGRRL